MSISLTALRSYSFACLVLTLLVELSGLAGWVETLAVGAAIAYFWFAFCRLGTPWLAARHGQPTRGPPPHGLTHAASMGGTNLHGRSYRRGNRWRGRAPLRLLVPPRTIIARPLFVDLDLSFNQFYIGTCPSRRAPHFEERCRFRC